MKRAGRSGFFLWVGACLSLSLAGCGAAGPAPSSGSSFPASSGAGSASPAPPPGPPVCALAAGLAPLPMPALADLQTLEPSRKNLRAWVDTLADPALRGRAAGSDENRRVADLLARALASFGLSAAPGGDHCVSFEKNGVRDQNVLGRFARGKKDDGGAAPEVLVGAHYDAQGARDGEVWPGGDDNASGVAAMLELARISALRGFAFDLGFAAFGAEERGALGSKAYVEAEAPRLSRLVLMINLDMVGRPLLDSSPLRLVVPRADEALAFVVGEREREKTRALLDRAATRVDRPLVGIPESVMTRLGYYSDSVPFGPHAPTIFLSDGALANYHQPTDTAAEVDIDQIERTVRLGLAILDELEKERETRRE